MLIEWFHWRPFESEVDGPEYIGLRFGYSADAVCEAEVSDAAYTIDGSLQAWAMSVAEKGGRFVDSWPARLFGKRIRTREAKKGTHMVAYLNSYPTAMSTPSNVLETITPALAEQYIAKNTHNRSVREPDVLDLAHAIEREEWRITNQGIAFDRNGVLIDGQHRLRAIMLAGKPVQMFVARGLAPDAAEAIDIGRKRTNADTLALSGYADSHTLAAATVWLNRYATGRMGTGQVKLTPQQTKAILAEHPGLVATTLIRPTPIRMITKSLVIWLTYEFTRRDDELGRTFMEKLCSGNNTVTSEPVAAVRKNLLRLLENSGRRNDTYRAAIVVKGWNATVEGRTVQLLRWAAGEPFPEILSHRSA